MTYAEQLNDRRWLMKRGIILERDDYRCVVKQCKNINVQLHVHHGVYIKGLMAWEYDDKYLHTLCDQCHSLTHSFMSEIYNQIGEINPGELWDIEYISRAIKLGHLGKIKDFVLYLLNNGAKD